MSTSRPADHLTVGYPPQSGSGQSGSPTATSPIEPPSGGGIRSPFGLSPNLNQQNKMSGAPRSGAGSPSHEMPGAGRLYSKRAREIQAQEGIASVPVNPWAGPPTSGNSTPLRENIPESPTDGFPDFAPLPAAEGLSQNRRARAGTVPSRFSPGGLANALLGVPGLPNNLASGPAPSRGPFKSPSPNLTPEEYAASASAQQSSVLLSRLRAGSLPQRNAFVPGPIPGTSSPFGPSIFSTWNQPTGRERGSTLASIASVGSNGPSSPAQSHYSREANGESDVHMRTLDYLGLAETPQPPRAQLATPYLPNYADHLSKAANRFRSYSVNNKDKYADDDEDDYDRASQMNYEEIQAKIAATQAAIHQHNNIAVRLQLLQSAAVSRPRARTAGVLDTPPSHALRSYYPTPSRLDNSMTAAEAHLSEETEYNEIPQAVAAVAAMTLGRSNSHNNGMLSAEEGLEGPTSALWLGSIPTSTTTSTLTEIFKVYGRIISARVLTHKNCGFINYERVEDAMAAKSELNGREIFPGQPAVRINFAKPASGSNTPGHDGSYPSPSPVPFGKGHDAQSGANDSGATGEAGQTALTRNGSPTVPPLRDMMGSIMDILKEFGATEEERYRISQSVQKAVSYDRFEDEIPPIKEPAHTRVHDAPKLRDIRKRIDNQALSPGEIESIAIDMLPEIAELSSDYLGNTVVQKLFEHCSDELRDSMLAEIAPHMAEIGVHKNGTWAAQKIIEVCTTPNQMSLIVQHLRPYTTPLFLDQYGNYVLQGCLKFGSPFNDFIFETMMSRMWEIGQGRYGARAMRACLESHHSTKDQQRMLAAAIATQSVQLATNANAALLLTWFLDTCTFPQRRTVLAPQLVPYLVYLCTHKVAYLTVLKVINQKTEPEARDTLLRALFFSQNDQTLEAILADPNSGATFIFKVLTTPFFDDSIRSQVVENVKAVLIRIKAQGNSGYKRLMDEVGLSTRSGGGGGGGRDHGNSANDRQRPGSRHTGQHHQQQHSHQQAQVQHQKQQSQPQGQAQGQFPSSNDQYYNSMNLDLGYGTPRSESVEPPQYPQYNGQAGLYPAVNPAIAPAAAMQMQYQQSMMARGGPPMNGYYPAMQGQFGGYHTPSPSIDQYRSQGLVNGSPVPPVHAQMAPNQSPYGAPGFGMPMGINGFAYGGMGAMGGMGGMQQQQQQQQQQPYLQEQGNTRRGRR